MTLLTADPSFTPTADNRFDLSSGWSLAAYSFPYLSNPIIIGMGAGNDTVQGTGGAEGIYN